MSQANLGWLFYKELYRLGDNSAHIKNTMEKLKAASGVDLDKYKLAEYGFTLKTTYPGLIIGSGYTHGISSGEDTKMGFYFDHTTGLPIIPGSSVKGVLRSFFGLAQNNQTDRYKNQKEEFIKELLEDNTINVNALANEIFEGIDSKTNKPLPIYKRDKFFDAVIVGVENGELIQDDYITPHKEPLKNPIPIKIIKVAAGISFKFQFDLKDSVISAAQKELLFLKLLLFSGLGAKTNVGYGQFEEWSDKELEKFQKKHQRDILKTIESEFEKLKIKLERQMIKNSKSIHDAIKKIENLSEGEKIILKELVDGIIDDKSGKWYKKIEKLL
jgi:CRISPR-associated protein Cmr6